MHQIAPYHKWRRRYISQEDKRSPFFGRTYNVELYSKKIYNYYIDSEWDEFGSQTLYTKILFADYDQNLAIMELMGEWNDCLYNDIMYLKREVIDILIQNGITKYIIICDNVLNFHASDDSYYEEWWDDIKDEDGFMVFINTRTHVFQEMESINIQYYANLGEYFNEYEWRKKTPKIIFQEVSLMLKDQTKQLY